MIFNVFDDVYEKYNLIGSNDTTIQNIVNALKQRLQFFIDNAYFRVGEISLAGFKAGIDSRTFTPWKDDKSYLNISTDFENVQQIYASLLESDL